MNCFNHQEKPSIILCLGCLKGLCNNCGQNFKYGRVCSEICHNIVWEREEINRISKKIYGIKNGKVIKKIPKTPLFIILLGIFFIFYALCNFYYYEFSLIDYIFSAQGLIFIIWGITTFVRQKNLGLDL
ncbi:MAG: hypothetical protein ACRYGR_09185 [Janthinobacterium lividum]